jgi:hypothetical protein
MGDELKYRISLKDGISAVLGRIGAGFRGLAGNVAGFARGAISLLTSLPSIIASGAIGAGMAKAIKAGFDVETMETQFKVLLGSVEAAKQRIAELQRFSSATPFELPGIAKASRMLHVFTGGVLGTTESLTLIGDAAAAVNQQIEDVSFWIGRAYSSIQAGQPFGESAMRLQEMGLLTGKARMQLDALTKSGASSAQIWGVLEGELKTFSGGMKTLSQTGNGLLSTLKDNARLAMAQFGGAFLEASKGGLSALIAKFDTLLQSNTFQQWGQGALAVARTLGSAFSWVRERIVAIAQSEGVQRLVDGLRVAVGTVKSLARGTTSLGAVLQQVGAIAGAALKLGFLNAVNFLASGLQAVIAGLTTAVGGAFATIASLSFWSGVGEIIIGSLASVGAYLIKIFTAPLDLVQAGMDTIMKGLMNWLAGLGGDRDENGVGRVGRRLGLGLQDNSFAANYAAAQANSTMGGYAREAAASGAGMLASGSAKLAAALKPVGQAVAFSVKDEFARSENLFDTTAASADLAAAAAGMKKYGQAIKLPDLKPIVAAVAAAGVAPGGGAAVAAAPAIAEAVKRSTIDIAARASWMRNVSAGRTPDDEIAQNTREMKEQLAKIAKAEGVV